MEPITKEEKKDKILSALLEEYFSLAKTENILHTPKITKDLDDLESAIELRLEKIRTK